MFARRIILSKLVVIESMTIRRPATIGQMVSPVNAMTTRKFSLKKTAGSGRRKPTLRKDLVKASNTNPPGPANGIPEDPWVSVLDKNSNQIYWWNQATNETTGLGAPRPQSGAVGPAVQPGQGGSMMGGLAGVVAEGMAFGVGSAIAHRAVGAVASSMFGGGSDNTGGGGGGGDDDGWDI